MQESEMRGLFLLAGFHVKKAFELANDYWPNVESYAKVRADNPWWLVRTEETDGLIRIGWRKRVISIDWEDTGLEFEGLTKDDVTKGKFMVHAWSMGNAVNYLTALRRELVAVKRADEILVPKDANA